MNKDNPKAAEEKFKEISEAYEVLADDENADAMMFKDSQGSRTTSGPRGSRGKISVTRATSKTFSGRASSLNSSRAVPEGVSSGPPINADGWAANAEATSR